MINIWKFDVGDRVQIIDIDNNIFIGRIDSLIDSEECSDLEKQEDNIGIVTDDKRYIDIYQSEIKNISLLSACSAESVARDVRLVSGK